MQKIFFILLNILFSTNLPVWLILNWNVIFNVGDSIDIMAYTGLLFVVFLCLYTTLKIEIFSIFENRLKSFQYLSLILVKLKSNKSFCKKFLMSIFFADMLIFLLIFLGFKFLKCDTKELCFYYLFSAGGVFVCYLGYLAEPWIKSRFGEQ